MTTRYQILICTSREVGLPSGTGSPVGTVLVDGLSRRAARAFARGFNRRERAAPRGLWAVIGTRATQRTRDRLRI